MMTRIRLLSDQYRAWRFALVWHRACVWFGAVALWCAAGLGRAEESGSDASFRPPPPRLPIVEPGPTLEGERFERRTLELHADFGAVHKLCRGTELACDNAAGFGLAVTGLARPSPFFAWGVIGERASLAERGRVPAGSWDFDTVSTSIALVGRVYAYSLGAWDPYLELGAGGGRWTTHGEVVDSRGRRADIEWSTRAPLLRAGAGVLLRVSSRVQVGARFGWTHWLLSRSEQCRDAAFGACTLPSFGHFDARNAVWSWQLGGTLLFGERH